MDATVRQRLKWVRMYAENGDAGLTCQRCGISRPILRLWVRRFRDFGEAGLTSRSRRPRHSPRQKVMASERDLILTCRRERNIGARRIQIELRLEHRIELSITTINKVLVSASVLPLRRPKRTIKSKRYTRPVPGDRVQMDTMKVVAAVYQCTAVDDCSRFRVLGVYPRRTAANSLAFLERVVEEMPFPIQRIQTDRGGEFMAENVQRWLADYAIKYRPIPPRSPHLNGKVERSQLTDLLEFRTRHDPKDPAISQRIDEWQFDYNWRRPHGSLGGKTPIERLRDLTSITPLQEDVAANYDASNERLRLRDFRDDLAFGKLWVARRELAIASSAAAADRL
jgi:transposase InsO family protein